MKWLISGNIESIQKVDIESQSELSNALYGLGIEDAFIPFKANFTKMSDNSGISLTNVSAIHVKHFQHFS